MSEAETVEARPYRLHNTIQNYAWGTRGANAYIPRLLGIEPEPDTPYAELWVGAHPKAPSQIELPGGSRVSGGPGVSLDRWIEADPEATLGRDVVARFGELPFLFKVLSAGQALSIQAHPTKAQAKALYARDPEHYPDDNHKPEIAVALDGLAALVGFRPFPELVAVLERYPELVTFVGPSIADRLPDAAASSPEVQQELTYDLFAALVQRALNNPEALEAAVDQLVARLASKRDPDERETFFLTLQQQYGSGDVGLFAFFLFNLVHLEPGEGIYTDAGVPHAYLQGNIVECMANSDNVVRVGLTPKFKDAETLLDIVDATPQAPDILGGTPEPVDAGVTQTVYAPPTPEFEVRRWRLDAGARAEIAKGAVPAVLIVIDGEITLGWEGGRMPCRAGESAFLPACLPAIRLHADQAATVVYAGVPASP